MNKTYVIVFIFSLFLHGCSVKIDSIMAVKNNRGKAVLSGNITSRLSIAAQLIEASYSHKEAKRLFTDKGLDVTYVGVPYFIFRTYPELYLLSNKETNEVTILIKGTDSLLDWYQDFKSAEYSDVKKEDHFYIPDGHAGFRKGVLKLIEHDFMKDALAEHIRKFDVAVVDKGKIKITLIGHSQGAGIAQVLAPTIEGFKYNAKNEPIKDPLNQYEVSQIFAYGVPLTLAKRGWQFMNSHYGDKTYMVIHDSDLVSTLYNVVTNESVNFKFFGQLVRINRDGNVVFEKTQWGSKAKYSDTPHAIAGYAHALKQASIK